MQEDDLFALQHEDHCIEQLIYLAQVEEIVEQYKPGWHLGLAVGEAEELDGRAPR